MSSLDPVTIPTEVVFWTTRAQQATTRCLDVSAGGDLTGFTIERTPDEAATVDLLMCGDGQWGGLGNNSYSNAQAARISPTGHVLATLDPSSGGDYELGNGKKTPGAASPVPMDAGDERLLLQRSGLMWGRGIKVEQFAMCGFGSNVVYWRLPVC
ncbi:hypothetical protein B0H13DRAFT_1994840 [Mycena leptocephala]|nr:hypothetical protein B0H13DRAFT_1994840 [Mycena leptocephala]